MNSHTTNSGFPLSDNVCVPDQPYKPRTEPTDSFGFDETTPLGAILFTLCETAEEAEAAKARAAGDDDYEAAYERARNEFDANFDTYHKKAFALLTEDEQIEAGLAGYAPAK